MFYQNTLLSEGVMDGIGRWRISIKSFPAYTGTLERSLLLLLLGAARQDYLRHTRRSVDGCSASPSFSFYGILWNLAKVFWTVQFMAPEWDQRSSVVCDNSKYATQAIWWKAVLANTVNIRWVANYPKKGHKRSPEKLIKKIYFTCDYQQHGTGPYNSCTLRKA